MMAIVEKSNCIIKILTLLKDRYYNHLLDIYLLIYNSYDLNVDSYNEIIKLLESNGYTSIDYDSVSLVQFDDFKTDFDKFRNEIENHPMKITINGKKFLKKLISEKK